MKFHLTPLCATDGGSRRVASADVSPLVHLDAFSTSRPRLGSECTYRVTTVRVRGVLFLDRSKTIFRSGLPIRLNPDLRPRPYVFRGRKGHREVRPRVRYQVRLGRGTRMFARKCANSATRNLYGKSQTIPGHVPNTLTWEISVSHMCDAGSANVLTTLRNSTKVTCTGFIIIASS